MVPRLLIRGLEPNPQRAFSLKTYSVAESTKKSARGQQNSKKKSRRAEGMMLNPVRDQKRSGKYGRGPALARHLVVRAKQVNAAIFSCHDLVLE